MINTFCYIQSLSYQFVDSQLPNNVHIPYHHSHLYNLNNLQVCLKLRFQQRNKSTQGDHLLIASLYVCTSSTFPVLSFGAAQAHATCLDNHKCSPWSSQSEIRILSLWKLSYGSGSRDWDTLQHWDEGTRRISQSQYVSWIMLKFCSLLVAVDCNCWKW